MAAVALRALLATEHEVVGVLTRPDARAGRGRSLQRSPVALVADAHGIPVLTPTTLRDPSVHDALAQLRPEVIPVVAYGNLVPPDLLHIAAHGWINLHFSLLPSWRGAAPVQWSILHGDEITGASTFLIGPGLDDGPVFGTVTERIRDDDTSGALLERLAEHGSSLLVATLDALAAHEVHPVDQPASGVTFAPKLTIDDARVRWDDPWVGVDRRIRATTPAPGAWSTLGDERIKLGPLRRAVAPEGLVLAPGVVHATRAQVWVGTATAPACLEQVQPAGRRLMAAADWARGVDLSGAVLA